MTDKVYIVANEEQEYKVLEMFEREGLKWKGFSKEPTQWLPTRDISYGPSFPYILFGYDVVSWCSISELKDDYEIVYDGRKESKIKISKEVYDALVGWKLDAELNHLPVYTSNLTSLPVYVRNWWRYNKLKYNDKNNRLIAIIRWVNGEDVFEVEKPKKWVVRSKETDFNNHYHYAILAHAADLAETYYFTYTTDGATKFDTKEEAESWANAHQEVVEVEDV